MCHQSAVPLCLSIKISAGVFKGMLKFDGTVGDSIWYCLCLFGVVVHDWSCAVEFTNYGGLTGALPTIGCLIIILILLRSGWKVCTCVRMTSVKSFPNRPPPHSKVMIKNPNALCLSLDEAHWVSCENVSSLWHGIWLRNTLHLGVVTPPVQKNSACETGLQKETNI